MTRQHGTDAAGRPVDLIGRRIQTGRGSVPGVVIRTERDTTMAKADRNGLYTVNGRFFKVRKGDDLPEGAEMVEDAQPTAGKTEQRAQQRAPENKARRSAPESKGA